MTSDTKRADAPRPGAAREKPDSPGDMKKSSWMYVGAAHPA